MTQSPDRVLVVEDEEFVRRSMVEFLEEDGYAVVEATCVEEGERAFQAGGIDVVLTDLRLPGRDGMELVRQLENASVPVVVITGHGTVEDAVQAMRAGAYDFVQKPVEPEQLVIVIRRALEHGRLIGEVHRLRESVDRLKGRRVLAGSSEAMQHVRHLIAQVAPTDATVLVTGESGTGKELVASEIHGASPRAEGPLVQVNCAAVVESLFESEFFGHRKGAFSGADSDRTGRFAEAEHGTLVLDELETLSLDSQAKLLRVLESGEYQRVGESTTRKVDVRVIAVSNEDLAKRVEGGSFRADLYYRLHVFPIEMPALRLHREDVPEIVEELSARVRQRLGTDLSYQPLDDEALGALMAYDWPGNVRELRNVLERAAILAQPSGRIGAEDLEGILALPAGRGSSASVPASANNASLVLRSRLEEHEREIISQALARSEGSRKEAARLLGIDPKNLGYYLKKHGLGG